MTSFLRTSVLLLAVGASTGWCESTTPAFSLSDFTSPTSTALPKGSYVGASLSHNELDFGSVISNAGTETATGVQAFVGLPLDNNIEGINSTLEIGVSRTSEFTFKTGHKEKLMAWWGAVALQKDLPELHKNAYGLARIGYDLGDDDGVFMGIGAGYRLLPNIDVRGEFINKDLVSVYQASVVLRF